MPATEEKTSFTTDEEARSIIGTRVFDAPRELVFAAWTDPIHVANWWGPRGFTTTTHEMDVRPGGTWRFTMHGPDGTDWPNEIVFLEIVKPERLVYTHGPSPIFDVTVTFTEERGKTRVTMKSIFESAAARDQIVEAVGAIEGMHQHLDRLGEYVAMSEAFVMTRSFPAPRALVFQVWTQEEHLKHWWGPRGVTIFSCTNDLRPGGIMHYGMRLPDGKEMWGRWIYREIVEPERIVFESSFADAQGNFAPVPFEGWPSHFLSTITFEEQERGTIVQVRYSPFEASDAEREVFDANRASLHDGWGGTLERLETYLPKA